MMCTIQILKDGKLVDSFRRVLAIPAEKQKAASIAQGRGNVTIIITPES